MDYTGNSNKDKEEKITPERKKVERVVQTEVIKKKRSLGRKFKDLFIEADFRSVVKYVISDVLLPAARNTIVDASTKGIERMMYGESATRRRGFGPGRSIVTYNNPINRGYSPAVSSRMAPAIGRASTRRNTDDFVLTSREEADRVLELMNELIDNYQVATLADLNELVGFPSSHIDNKWGWTYLADVQVRQIREGYLIDLPPAEPV